MSLIAEVYSEMPKKQTQRMRQDTQWTIWQSGPKFAPDVVFDSGINSGAAESVRLRGFAQSRLSCRAFGVLVALCAQLEQGRPLCKRSAHHIWRTIDAQGDASNASAGFLCGVDMRCDPSDLARG